MGISEGMKGEERKKESKNREQGEKCGGIRGEDRVENRSR